ncbi:MAG: hypothetical protein HYX75_13495 [Acidobacteria bacterium]|nr:hypothetical protein [Acidobacteriota bacterium]
MQAIEELVKSEKIERPMIDRDTVEQLFRAKLFALLPGNGLIGPEGTAG